MKTRTLLMAAPLCGSMILARPAAAEFLGLFAVQKPDALGIFTVNIYAQFTGREGDFVYAVNGTWNRPLNVNLYGAFGGTFYQNPFGGDLPPNQLFFTFFPSLEYDTFVTIGRKTTSAADPDLTSLATRWPGFDNCGLEMDVSAWYISPWDINGNPTPQGIPDANGRVLLMQLSIEGAAAESAVIYGTILVSGFNSPGGVENAFQEYVSFQYGEDFCLCLWNLNGDCQVGINDLLILLAAWGDDSCYLVLEDGTVGIDDLMALLANWGPCPKSECCP